MKPIIIQLNPTVGDIDGNVQRILGAARAYAEDSTAMVIFPELAITGYPPEDWLTRPEFIARAMAALHGLVEQSQTYQCAMLVGSVWEENGLIYNAALFIHDGKIKHIHKKNCLPNYGVFDERRYFAQGSAPVVFEHLGQQLGVLICEDGWFEHNWRLLKTQGAGIVMVVNASPFEVSKQTQRIEHFSAMANRHGLKIIYANMSGAQDDLVFDGASFIIDDNGTLLQQLDAFDGCIPPSSLPPPTPPRLREGNIMVPYPSETEAIWRAIGSGLRNYMVKNRVPSVVLGLSGGIDSALVATLAVDVLGAEHVHGVLMPSEFTSDASNQDALALAGNLGIQTSTVPITALMDAAEETLIPNLTRAAPESGVGDVWKKNLTIGGNLQARLRGNIVMAFSNTMGGVVLNTSNKSEIAVGYSTMYGDACGAYSPLKDVYKTMVYQLAAWRNQQSAVIPEAIIQKAPSAELAPGQQDSDQLPPYDILDKILHGLIEEKKSAKEVAGAGMDVKLVQNIHRMIRASEYKRRQFPPGPKVTSMLFGKDWRYPISSRVDGE